MAGAPSAVGVAESTATPDSFLGVTGAAGRAVSSRSHATTGAVGALAGTGSGGIGTATAGAFDGSYSRSGARVDSVATGGAPLSTAIARSGGGGARRAGAAVTCGTGVGVDAIRGAPIQTAATTKPEPNNTAPTARFFHAPGARWPGCGSRPRTASGSIARPLTALEASPPDDRSSPEPGVCCHVTARSNRSSAGSGTNSSSPSRGSDHWRGSAGGLRLARVTSPTHERS